VVVVALAGAGVALTPSKRKVFAYITPADGADANRLLLVFEHVDFPEAGVQVPAGTVEPGEAPDAAVLREAHEETGLEGLTRQTFLGYRRRDMADVGIDAVHHQYFFHLHCATPYPETWRHAEMFPSDGGTEPIRFVFYWVNLRDAARVLTGDHGALLDRLAAHLGA
jgi:8-oxo-dGTP pyrophosphatase MutT (NUDIX family)